MDESVRTERVPEDVLATRYGVAPRDGARQRWWALLGAGGVGIVLVAWLWWAGLAQPTAQFETRDLGYQMVSESEIIVQFEVSAPPGLSLQCAVQALNAQYGIVGWKIVDIPEATVRTRVFDQPLRTSEPAVTGLLYECWVP